MNFTHPTRRTIIASATALSLGVFSLAGVGVATAHRSATIEADGQTIEVSGFITTVEDALASANVTLGEHDEVQPELKARFVEGNAITVRRAHPYAVEKNGTTTHVWSTAASIEEFVAQLPSGNRMLIDRSAEKSAVPFFAKNSSLELVADGKSSTVEVSAHDNPTSILTSAQISLSDLDRLYWLNNNGKVALKITRVLHENKVTTDTIPAPTEERHDDTLYEGETRVIQDGVDGAIVTTTFVETVDGHVTHQRELGTQRTEPVTHIVAHGTKQRPTPAVSSGAVVSGDVWAALAHCESRGNPSANTGNGYYGMYQFSLPTWNSVGGSGLPSNASAAEQTMRAQILQQRSGWGQWPACSRSLGLY